jgi:thiol-disulfide isomerase/thioredoxin
VIRWYHLLLGSVGRWTVALTCPACRAKLRLGRVANLLMRFLDFAGLGLGIWGVILLALIVRAGFLGYLRWLIVCLGVAGLLQGLVRMGYVSCRKSLVVQTAGHFPPKSIRLYPFLVCIFLSLTVYAGLGALLGVVLQLGITRWERPQLPSGPDLPVLGRVDPGWKLETLDGQDVSFGSFQGRAVFLNIWATWCLPCVAEVPSIQDLHDALKDEGVAVVLVTQETPEAVRAFVEKKGWHVPIYLARSGVPVALQSDGIPATFLLNRRGEVLYRHIGRADWNTEDCRAFLRRLQQESTGSARRETRLTPDGTRSWPRTSPTS